MSNSIEVGSRLLLGANPLETFTLLWTILLLAIALEIPDKMIRILFWFGSAFICTYVAAHIA